MKITKRQLKRIIKEERVRMLSEQVDPELMEALSAAVLEIFYADGQVTTVDVFDRLRMDGYTDEEIDAALDAT